MKDQRPAANAAILYRPDGYDTSGEKLMGRQAAGEGFLKGLCQHGDVDALYCYAPSRGLASHFSNLVAGFGNTRPVHWLDEGNAASPGRVGTLYSPGPRLSSAAWRRRAHGQGLYSIAGVTHTTASEGAMDAILGMLSAPVQEWDALVCTSTVVRDTVEVLLGEQQEYLASRFGATQFVRPQLPVIPLGVDTEAFKPDADRRKQARAALGIAPGDIVVLFVGRLSFHAKAHPVAMYLGLERAAQQWSRRGGKVHLVQAGWFFNESIERAYREGAALFCPSVNAIFLDGRKPVLRGRAWAAADIFTSLSDNFQETFGLVPIEAMAAGLPGVVSDWNGYRDTVRDGIDGLRVPTMMPRPGLGLDLADRHAAGIDNYEFYCGFSSQMVAIEPEAVAAAYLKLMEDEPLRLKMGAAARARAVEHFDWSVVIARYQELWQELATIRARGAESAPLVAGHPSDPSRPDPFLAFQTYPSDILSDEYLISLAPDANAGKLYDMLKLPLYAFFRPMVPNLDDCGDLLSSLGSDGPRTVSHILASVEDDRRARMERGLVWLAKLGLVRISRA